MGLNISVLVAVKSILTGETKSMYIAGSIKLLSLKYDIIKV